MQLLKKYKFLAIVVFLSALYLIGNRFFEKDYNVDMKEILKIKQEEAKAGISPKLFDLKLEPDFPMSDVESIEGVDVNNDGVRDDIEIWINRTAEDEKVRKRFKDYYRRYIAVMKGVSEGVDDNEYNRLITLDGMSGSCFIIATTPYNRKYRAYEVDAGTVYIRKLDRLFANNQYRKNIFNRFDKRIVSGSISMSSSQIRKYCDSI